jgi:hypothetical protein
VVSKCHFHGKGRNDRAGNGDDVLIADYLIEFEIVDVAGGACCGP